MNKKKTFLYLDDIRNINDSYEAITVRNYYDFVSYIENNGLPDIISFDHDLGEDIAIYKVKNGILTKRKARKEKKEVKSGYDCAKWLISYCIENNLFLPEVYVHSQNTVGSENIKSLINNFKINCNHNPDCITRQW